MRPLPVASSDRWQRRSGSASASADSYTSAGGPRSAAPASPSVSAALSRSPIHARVTSSRCWTSRRSARYGSGASTDARAQLRAGVVHRQLAAKRLDLAPRRATPRSSATSGRRVRVTSGVTFGLPSRSPPIQEPNRIGAASIGNAAAGHLLRALRSSARRYCGSASHSVCSNTVSADRTSSSGDGRSRRTSSVSQAAVISRRRSSTRSSCSRSVRSVRSRSASSLGDASVLLLQRPPHDLGRMRRERRARSADRTRR